MKNINTWINFKAMWNWKDGFYTSQDFAGLCTYESVSDFNDPHTGGKRRFISIVKSEIGLV